MDEQDIIKALAEEVGLDAEDGEVTGRGYGNGITISFGDIEYLVYESYEDAEEGAKEDVKYLLDDIGYEGLNWDAIGGISKFVDEDWFEQAFREMGESYLEDIDEEEMEEQYGTTDPDEALEKYMENYSDPIEEFISEFGEKEFREVVQKYNLIDDDEVAEAIVQADGPANSLAGYDGKEIEFGDGMYAYRTN